MIPELKYASQICYSSEQTLEFSYEMAKKYADKPGVYSKEMQNNPVAAGDVGFSASMFRYWKEEDGMAVLMGADGEVKSRYALKDCKAAIACDLAWEEDKRADYTAISFSGFSGSIEMTSISTSTSAWISSSLGSFDHSISIVPTILTALSTVKNCLFSWFK